MQVSSKPKASEMCLACAWKLTCSVARQGFKIWFFLLSGTSGTLCCDWRDKYLNFGIISKNWKCSYLLCLLNRYAADRVKQVELKSSLLEAESVQDESCFVPLVEPEINSPLMEQSYNTIISLPIITVKSQNQCFSITLSNYW